MKKKGKDASESMKMSSNKFFRGSAKKPGADVKAAPTDKKGSTSGAPRVAHAARAGRLKNVKL